MPLVKKRVTVAAGATSDQILAGTTYEYVGANTRLQVAASDATGTYEGATNLNFTVNNTEVSKDCLVSEQQTGDAFGWNGSPYLMNNFVTTGNIRNRPVITFTNTGANSADIDVAIFIS